MRPMTMMGSRQRDLLVRRDEALGATRRPARDPLRAPALAALAFAIGLLVLLIPSMAGAPTGGGAPGPLSAPRPVELPAP